jgi:hypothetical protein
MGQLCILFESTFSSEGDLVLPLSNSSIFSFSEDHRVAAYIFYLVLPSILSPLNITPQTVVNEWWCCIRV